jgi:transcriptional regulator with XRE-family HTH domain
MTFGEQIRKLRLANHQSQPQLAERVRIHVTYLSKIENNRVSPPARSVIERIARALHCEEDELLLLARKLPASYVKQIQQDSLVADFLRTAPKLNDSQRHEIRRIIHELEGC